MKRIELILNLSMIVVGLLIFGIAMTQIEMPSREAPAEAAAESANPEPSITPTETTPPTAQPTATRNRTLAAPTILPSATATALPPTATATPSLTILTNTLNIVLLGSDRRPDDTTWRTDTIILVAIDPINKTAGAISVPRDLWVTIPNRAPNRVNTLDEFGGPTLVKQVLGANLGIPIDYYVRIDFGGFQKAVDALGGITVNVDCPLSEGYPDASKPDGIRHDNFPAGKVPMNGQLALDYARSRLSTSVYDRMRRQLRVLLAVREKLLSPAIFPHILDLWDATRNLIQTDVPARNILPLAKLGGEIKVSDVHSIIIDWTMTRQTYSPQGWWILIADQAKIRAAAQNLFKGPTIAESVQKTKCS